MKDPRLARDHLAHNGDRGLFLARCGDTLMSEERKTDNSSS